MTPDFFVFWSKSSNVAVSIEVTLFMDTPTGFCDKTTFHDEDVVHMCAICKEMFGASFFHPAKSCEILKKLDSGTITTGIS